MSKPLIAQPPSSILANFVKLLVPLYLVFACGVVHTPTAAALLPARIPILPLLLLSLHWISDTCSNIRVFGTRTVSPLHSLISAPRFRSPTSALSPTLSSTYTQNQYK
ncbi:hypothetical protein AYI70_g5869 [Smittium culicis]|uniref:Uncharacterized protein n=1 Tax=Smittium culicis TaxID=133412 RepID=A0A1R1XST8_9FUNG|nr:hypothetical protein AYI70_g5869 [Smittium culicis]